ncbi:MAG: hypothetical protein KJO91_09960, partial [Gammaproteobacteria bacterium]|nr:hypothetical protein [Gammaproteobacteria bacterium]
QYPDGILVSRDSIEQLRKQLRPKQQRESTISLIEIDADTKSYQLVCDGAVVMFTPVDGKFPDIDRVIPDPSACSVSNPITTGFDWDYMALFQKINKALTGNKLASPALLPNKEGNSAARIGFSAPCEDVVGVIMPKRL